MATIQCLLCDTRFNRPANHFCARECRPASHQHADFCRACRAACLRALETDVVELPVREGREDHLNG